MAGDASKGLPAQLALNAWPAVHGVTVLLVDGALPSGGYRFSRDGANHLVNGSANVRHDGARAVPAIETRA
jgi:hypothetical protein